jgi:hypothetical protein
MIKKSGGRIRAAPDFFTFLEGQSCENHLKKRGGEADA